MESNARFRAGQLVCAVPVLPRGPNVPVGYAPEAPGGFGQYVLGYDMAEFEGTLQRIADGGLDVAPLITHSVGLDEVADAFDALAEPDAYGKVVVRPWLAGHD